jgi:uncharacterized membrane protein YkoI
MIDALLLVGTLLDDPAPATRTGTEPIVLAQAASSPDQAAAQARAQTGGRVLGVEWGESGGQPVYVVRVLMPDGSIREVPIPASGDS